ncbi:MAG: NCS1 family nucleobase:cation symporter-1 [Rubrobacteraceae bacterium]
MGDQVIAGTGEVAEPVSSEYSERLYNEDLRPLGDDERGWSTYSLFATWMADVHSIGGYTMAAGLFFLGLAGWQVFLALMVGILAVYYFMNLISVAGQRQGVPYPVLARISFGVFGANIPALIRAVIATFWYGIQTWLASVAVVILVLQIFPGLEPLTESSFLGLSTLGWGCFLAMWLAQLLVLRHGMDSIKTLVDWSGPAIYVAMFALAAWIWYEAGSDMSFTLGSRELGIGETVLLFFTAVALVVNYFSTLMLNFCDFSRWAPSESMVRKGNFWGLPVNFMLFSAVVVITTAGSIAVYGEAITDPVELVAEIPSTVAIALGALTFALATIGINIVANFVGPSYDFANAFPKYIDFKRGGLITAVLAIAVMPWHIFNSPVAINYFLGGLGALLGPIFGVIVVDYYLIKRGRIQVHALFREGANEPYWYKGGINPDALYAFIPASAISLVIALVPFFGVAAPFSWFIGAGIAAALYWMIAKRNRTVVLGDGDGEPVEARE